MTKYFECEIGIQMCQKKSQVNTKHYYTTPSSESRKVKEWIDMQFIIQANML